MSFWGEISAPPVQPTPTITTGIDCYLTPSDGSPALHFPITPQRIAAVGATKTLTFSPMAMGDVDRPAGDTPYVVSWDGILPGARRRSMTSLVKADWLPPNDLAVRLDTWRRRGAKLDLLVTGSPIHLFVFISRFEYEVSGGHGDLRYKIEYKWWRDLLLYAEHEIAPASATDAATGAGEAALAAQDTSSIVAGARADAATADGSTGGPGGAGRTYTVVAGDSLWDIARLQMGSGSQSGALYEANRATIGPNRNLITPGMQLVIP